MMDVRDQATLEQIQQIARQRFKGARGSHDWDHTLRVVDLCRRLGPAENADMMILLAAAYLHDIGRAEQDHTNGSVCHAAKGARLAAEILSPMSLGTSQKKNIIHSIRAHRFRDGHTPKSIEAKVLFDADKLDAIGAVGIARAYLFAGELGACLHNPDVDVTATEPYSKNDTGYREYVVKLSTIKDRMLTREGRQMAQERHNFMAAFFKRFLEEYTGKC